MAHTLDNANGSLSKTCTTCKVPKPLTEFRRLGRFRPGRVCVCRGCHAKTENEGYHRRKGRVIRKTVNGFVRNANRARSENEVVSLTKAMISRFGGHEQLAQAWHQEITRQSEAGSPKVLASFGVLSQLIQYADSQRPAEPGCIHLSEAELEHEKRISVLEIVRDDPVLWDSLKAIFS